jgi:hypothetical protein
MSRLPAALLNEVVDQLARRVVHLDVERLHLISEIVERPDGRDSDQQSESSCDQRLGDTAGDGRDACRVLRGDLTEGLENTGDGSEQTDEGRG